MRLPLPNEKEVEEFKRMYQQEFGVELTDAEALDAAIRLVQLVALLNMDILQNFKDE